jgi:hypothetical protein
MTPSRIMIDDSRLTLQIVLLLTDDSRGVIYDHNKFIVQAAGVKYLLITNLLAHLLRASAMKKKVG